MPMLFIRQKFDKVLVLLISAVGFCLLSYRPISSITPEMPKEFVDISSIGNRRQRLTEERVAKAYWDCVVNNIQWEYHYGSSLPQNPPQDFMPVRADVTTVDTATNKILAKAARGLVSTQRLGKALRVGYQMDYGLDRSSQIRR